MRDAILIYTIYSAAIVMGGLIFWLVRVAHRSSVSRRRLLAMQPIHLHFDSGCGEQQYSRILNLLTNLNERQERLMQEQQSAFQRLDARIAKIESGIAEMKDRIQTDFDYLKTQLNSGNQISVTELETLEARLNNIISVMTEVDPIPEIPTPEAPAVQAQHVADQSGGITNDPIPEATQTQLTEGSNEPVIIPTS